MSPAVFPSGPNSLRLNPGPFDAHYLYGRICTDAVEKGVERGVEE